MIDHLGIPVSDYAHSKAFYEKALVLLGYSVIMEVQQDGTAVRPAGLVPVASRISGSAAKAD